MESSWSFHNPVQVYFGAGVRKKLLEQITNKRCLFVTTTRGRRQIEADEVLSCLIENNLINWVTDISSNPDVVELQNLIDEHVNSSFDFVVGFVERRREFLFFGFHRFDFMAEIALDAVVRLLNAVQGTGDAGARLIVRLLKFERGRLRHLRKLRRSGGGRGMRGTELSHVTVHCVLYAARACVRTEWETVRWSRLVLLVSWISTGCGHPLFFSVMGSYKGSYFRGFIFQTVCL